MTHNRADLEESAEAHGRHVALILAKDGSHGLPGKNLLTHQSKPLLIHTLEAVEQSGLFDEVFVSTNGPEIAKYAVDFGAALIARPDSLAANDRYVDAVNQAVASITPTPATITVPMVVQPIREEGIFARILASHDDGVDSVVTVTPFESCVDWIFTEDDSGQLDRCDNILYGPAVGRRSDLFIIDNAVVSFTYESWQRSDSLSSWPYLGRRIRPLVQRRDNANFFVDINTADDAEWLDFVATFPDWRSRRIG